MKKSILILLSVVLISCTGNTGDITTDGSIDSKVSGDRVDISDSQVAEPSSENQVSEGDF